MFIFATYKILVNVLFIILLILIIIVKLWMILKIFMFPDGGTRQTSNDVNSLLPLLMCNGGFGGGN